MESFFEKFKLKGEKEELVTVITNIENGVIFRGTNLWVLIFAVFLASLGLNMNSAAVIIGAMLISPLMGPIMGIGLGVGIHDISLLKKAMYNYGVATIVALMSSTLFFLMSPLDDAHSELLARTSPTIYDVLIALFGGLAGIVATCSRQKGNVIPGVAIATALMPPLCTAGYGLATLQLNFFYGAFYLYIINSVFIALATFIIVRLLHFPYRHLRNKRADKIAQRIVWLVALITLIPSIYFGIDLVEQNRFTENANRFITNEAHFTDDYLLSKKVNAKDKSIILVFGGKEISANEINTLKNKLQKYDLAEASLEIKQGFSFLAASEAKEEKDQMVQLTLDVTEKDKILQSYKKKLDSISTHQEMGIQVFEELKIQYPAIRRAIIQPGNIIGEKSQVIPSHLVVLYSSATISLREKNKIEAWLKKRLGLANINLIITPV